MRKKRRFGVVWKVVKALLFIGFLPLTLLIKILRGRHRIITKIAGALFCIFFLLPAWGILSLISAVMLGLVVTSLGLVKVPIPVTGSSMMPTITDGSSFSMLTYKNSLRKPALAHGDIITFENAQTDAGLRKENKSGALIKRVIGLPGDTVEIKDGFVYRNNELLAEPYIAKPRSTFGHEEIRDCQKIVVPPDHVLAMGDNRFRSADSRDYGLAAFSDIEYILPFSDQSYLRPKWRDTANDAKAAQTSMLDTRTFVELLNRKRSDKGLKTLSLDPKLSKSALLRANAILKYNDSSYDATISGYPQERSMADAGYYNIIYGEHIIFGYYEAQDLLDYLFENPKNDDFYLKKDYQDIGIATEVGNFDGCPVQIVVQQLAGYVPPNYKQSDIDSWKGSLNRLREIQPSWERLKTYDRFYSENKSDVDRITSIISQRISNISTIVTRMEANQWLTATEKGYIDADRSLYNEQVSLADKLNSK